MDSFCRNSSRFLSGHSIRTYFKHEAFPICFFCPLPNWRRGALGLNPQKADFPKRRSIFYLFGKGIRKSEFERTGTWFPRYEYPIHFSEKKCRSWLKNSSRTVLPIVSSSSHFTQRWFCLISYLGRSRRSSLFGFNWKKYKHFENFLFRFYLPRILLLLLK